MMVVPYASLEFVALPGRDSADPFRNQRGMLEANLSVRIVRLVADEARSAHVHARSAEAIYVARGHGTLWTDGIRTRLDAGATALIPAGVPHATVPDPHSEMVLVCFFPHPDLAANIEELTLPLG